MSIIYSFIYGFIVCAISELIINKTKLSFGHVTSMFVVTGAVLSFFGIYDVINDFAMAGGSIPILSFGNLLYKAAADGLSSNGFLGLFNSIMTTTSAGISAAIIFPFIFSIFSKPKE